MLFFKAILLSITFAIAACAGSAFEWDAARKIQPGMTEKQVTDLVGPPYSVRSDAAGNVIWVWSYANGMTGGHRSLAISFKDGKVVTVPQIPSSF